MKDSLHANVNFSLSHPLGRLIPHSPIRLELATLSFLIANALDVYMTYLLLTHENMQFVESNPVARFFLNAWGFAGMACFKMVFVAIVVLNAQIIARQKEEIARRLYHCATFIVSSVVVYSMFLMLQHS